MIHIHSPWFSITMVRDFFRPLWAKDFWVELFNEVNDDNLSNGAAALAFYSMLSLFPALIFLLSVLPYLPIENLYGEVMTSLRATLPDEAAQAVSSTIAEITLNKKASLLSFGALFTLWSASAGVYAAMLQLNTTYDVIERRPYWKVRGLAILLTLGCGFMLVTAFALIVGGGALQGWLDATYVLNPIVAVLFQLFRWLMIVALLLGGFALIDYYGPDRPQVFQLVSPGSVVSVVTLIISSLLFRLYVSNFANYSASYGSLGAIIALMMWFYIAGHVVLLGSEINAIVEDRTGVQPKHAETSDGRRHLQQSNHETSWARPRHDQVLSTLSEEEAH